MRQYVVSYVGTNNVGGDVFDLSLSIPDPSLGEPGATPRQRAAVEGFYEFELPADATDSQAHALLTYRDFAHAVVERAAPDLRGRPAATVPKFVAAYISQDEAIAADVTDWCERRFERAADPDKMGAAAARRRHYPELKMFVDDVLADMREAGAAI